MKKKILSVAAIAICLAVLASGTLAYFTAEDQVHNVITSSAVDIAIEEWQDEVGGTPYPDEPIKVMPGTTVSKIVTVKNIEAKSYIRANFEIIITDANGNVMDIPPETLASIVTVAVNGEHWQQKTDELNWWYYTDAVATGVATEPLFTEVVFDGPNMTNEYQNCTVEINVYAQAVQTANNGDSALEAAGWPEN